MFSNIVPLAQFNEFKNFMKQVIDWDKAKFVLKKE